MTNKNVDNVIIYNEKLFREIKQNNKILRFYKAGVLDSSIYNLQYGEDYVKQTEKILDESYDKKTAKFDLDKLRRIIQLSLFGIFLGSSFVFTDLSTALLGACIIDTLSVFPFEINNLLDYIEKKGKAKVESSSENYCDLEPKRYIDISKYRSYDKDNSNIYDNSFLNLNDKQNIDSEKLELLTILDEDFKLYYTQYNLPPIKINKEEWNIFFDELYDFYKKQNLGKYLVPQMRKFFRYAFANIISMDNYGICLSEINIYNFVHSINKFSALNVSDEELGIVSRKVVADIGDYIERVRK